MSDQGAGKVCFKHRDILESVTIMSEAQVEYFREEERCVPLRRPRLWARLRTGLFVVVEGVRVGLSTAVTHQQRLQ